MLLQPACLAQSAGFHCSASHSTAAASASGAEHSTRMVMVTLHILVWCPPVTRICPAACIGCDAVHSQAAASAQTVGLSFYSIDRWPVVLYNVQCNVGSSAVVWCIVRPVEHCTTAMRQQPSEAAGVQHAEPGCDGPGCVAVAVRLPSCCA
jgi:hypothetical protein